MSRIEEIEARKAEIRELMAADDADLDALTEEARALNAEIEEIRANAKKAEELRNLVAKGEGKTVETAEIEERKDNKAMENKEFRNTPEYITAFANYIKTGRADELRAAAVNYDPITSNNVPVPEFVEDIIRTAWERDGITNLVRKSYLKGIVRVGFEIEGDDAVIHEEGAEAPAEESLTLGIATLTPVSIKKWLTITDETLGLAPESFLRYVYDELTYRIAKKAADQIIYSITHPGSGPSVGVVAGAPSLTTTAEAIAKLADAAQNPVVVMNRGTWAQFKALQYAAGYAIDPFEGLNVVFNNSLPVYSASLADVTAYMIVGDFNAGYLANFPNGDEVTIKYDDLSLAELDLVKVVGRMYVGLGVVAPGCFTVVFNSEP